MKIITLAIAAVLLFSCAPAPAKTPTNDPKRYPPSVDESVMCPEIHPQLEDIKNIFVDNVLSVEANTRRTPGLYMNAIAADKLDFVDDSTYTVSGEFRIPEGAENEQFDINFQLVENFTEYHSEILLDQNPHSPLYGWVWTRFQDLNAPVRLMQIPLDHSWHTFSQTVQYTSSPKRRVMRSITVDGRTANIDHDMGTLPKDWESSFFVLMETTNLYPRCGSPLVFVGKSEWRNIEVKREKDG